MITSEYANGRRVTVYAAPDMSMNVERWNEELGRTIGALIDAGVSVSQEGTNASAERWPLTFTMNDAARKILEESPLCFEDSYPGI